MCHLQGAQSDPAEILAYDVADILNIWFTLKNAFLWFFFHHILNSVCLLRTLDSGNTANFRQKLQPVLGQDLLIIQASRSNSDTPHSVGLLWISDQPIAETSTTQHTIKPSMFSSRLEPAIPVSENHQTHVLDGAAAGMANVYRRKGDDDDDC
jgi:hypothetical protein